MLQNTQLTRSAKNRFLNNLKNLVFIHNTLKRLKIIKKNRKNTSSS